MTKSLNDIAAETSSEGNAMITKDVAKEDVMDGNTRGTGFISQKTIQKCDEIAKIYNSAYKPVCRVFSSVKEF